MSSDSSPFVRQRFSEDSTDSVDELKPLSPASSSSSPSSSHHHNTSRRCNRKFLRISSKPHHNHSSDDEEEITCFGNVWRLVASVALSLVLVLPFLYSFYQYNKLGHQSLIIPNYPSDLLQCAQDLNVSFALLHRQTQLATDYCSGAQFCSCINPLQPFPHVPSSPQYAKQWDTVFARNVADAAAADTLPTVVLYGDSITEHWTGTDLGDATQETMSVKKQFDTIFDDGQALALGLAGDRVSQSSQSERKAYHTNIFPDVCVKMCWERSHTFHFCVVALRLLQCPQLLYRLQNGELPSSLDPPVIWLLIGTNDLYDNCSRESTLVGIVNIVQYLSDQRPHAHIVINSILPKPNPSSREWEGTSRNYPAITWINERLACYAKGMSKNNVEYFDASMLFLDDADGTTVPQDVMPDGVHPSGKGSRIWGEAILKRVEEIMEERASNWDIHADRPPPFDIVEWMNAGWTDLLVNMARCSWYGVAVLDPLQCGSLGSLRLKKICRWQHPIL